MMASGEIRLSNTMLRQMPVLAQSQDPTQDAAVVATSNVVSDTLQEIVVNGTREAAVAFATTGVFVFGVLWPSNTAFDDTTMGADQKPPSKSRQSKPKNAPPGTKPIDQSGLDRGDVHGIKDGIGAGAQDWVGITPNGDVITTNPDGTAQNHGPASSYTN